MKIELKNFGPIHNFKFDLDKDLHIIYGENNIGKSYAIGAVYLILKNLKGVYSTAFNPFTFVRSSSADSIIDYIKKQKSRKKNNIDELDISTQFNNYIKEIFDNSFVRPLKKSITNSYSEIYNLKNKFNPKGDCEIIITLSNLSIILLLENSELLIKNFHYNASTIVKYVDQDEISNKKQRGVYMYVKRRYNRKEEIGTELYNKISITLTNIISDMLVHIRSLHFLPASRSGLYQGLTALPPILAKLSQVRYAINASLEIPALPEPVSDYFLSLSNVKTSKNKTNYSLLAQKIENEILGAEIVIDPESSKIEYYNKSINLRLDLSETSSMISEVAPIVAYLKYIIDESNDNDFFPYYYRYTTSKIKGSHLIFIEEPEAHLHPKIQVKMMEIFAEMVKSNIKVVMTTHSDYIKDKLTNLLLSGILKANDVSSYHFLLGEKGSYDAGDMKATEEGIEDHNFTKIAEDLYEERLTIYEEKNKSYASGENKK